MASKMPKYERLNGEDAGSPERNPERHPKPPSRWPLFTLSILLAVSLLLNIYPYIHYRQTFPKSLYANLSPNIPTKWTRHSPFNTENRTAEDLAWNTSRGFQVRTAIIALPDTFTTTVGLPSAQRWPWDRSKGIYFVEGLHALHCVKYLRKTVLEAHDGLPLSVDLRHLKHCLDGLRQFVQCHADDTPRYTGRLHDQKGEAEPFGGIGQRHMCRDWDGLMDWVEENSACYRYVDGDEEGFTEKERYKSCPDGSTPWEGVA